MRPARPSRVAGAVIVRPALPAELPEVGAVTARAYAADGTVDQGYLSVLADAAGRARHSEIYVAADAGGAVLGAVAFAAHGSRYAELAAPGEAELRMLAVHPAARGCGVGRLLVLACVRQAREIGSLRLVLSTAPSMATAHRLYVRLGFRRLPNRDWEPATGLRLLAYALELIAPRNSARSTSARVS